VIERFALSVEALILFSLFSVVTEPESTTATNGSLPGAEEGEGNAASSGFTGESILSSEQEAI